MSLIVDNIVLPTKVSSASEFINYHKKLVEKFGKLNANTIFLMTWEKVGNEDVTDESKFVSYFDSFGIDVSSVWARGRATWEGLGDEFMGLAGTAGRLAKYAMPVIGIGALIAGTYLSLKMIQEIKKTVKKTGSDIQSLNNMSAADKLQIISKVA